MTWWKTAKPGDKIVCIRKPRCECCGRDDCGSILPSDYLEVGAVYTIRQIFMEDMLSDEPFVTLMEKRWNSAYLAGMFRPVERDRTSAEVEKLKRFCDHVPASPEVVT